MTFTYAGDLVSDLDKTRFYIQDVTEDDGPRPARANFTDEEIDGVNTIAGTWQRTVYILLHTLAAAWSRYADIAAGPRRESLSQIAKQFRADAATWAKEQNIMPGIQVAGTIKVDGYSDDITSDDVQTATEYDKVRIAWTEYGL